MSRNAELRLGDKVVSVTNLDRVLWPQANFTKADLLAYYAGVAPVLLPYLRDRAVVTVRAPTGVDGRVWFQTNAHHPPEWVRTAAIAARDDGVVYHYAVIEDEASLMWACNLSSIELHPFLFRTRSPDRPDFIVFDLDPGPPADLAACCRVALLLRERVVDQGRVPHVKTSGHGGVHVFVPVADMSFDDTKAVARDVAQRCEAARPDLVVARSDKTLREGRVFIDWAQNNRMRQLVAPYSPRAAAWPFVSTPVSWDEVSAAAAGQAQLRFGPGDVLERIDRGGDPFEGVRPA